MWPSSPQQLFLRILHDKKVPPDNCSFIGDDCDSGVFTPLKNSKYDIVVIYDGEEYIGYVGCRAGTSSQNGKLYKAGEGISISDSNEVSVKVVDGSGLSVDSNGINLDISDKLSNKANKQTDGGGFIGGKGAVLLSGQSGASIGEGAISGNGGAIGANSKAYDGGAVGKGAQTSNGFAGGDGA